MGTEIPSPPGYPLLGNVNALDPEHLLESQLHLADVYGTIARLCIRLVS